jgi:7,8-dihydropterin-6-yl-methyl-4-(beta-D-ribofuranosyl)aminobenzene 5'-phosphate synthase
MKMFSLFASIALIAGMGCTGQSGELSKDGKLPGADEIVFTILCDNNSQSDSIFADHGFSCLITAGAHTCLYDAGNNADKLISNVNKLGVDCSRIDNVFISHIHSDHLGGLSGILDECNKPTLCMPVSYPRQEGESFGEQADRDYEAMLNQFRPSVSELTQHEGLAHLGGNFYTTGIIEKQSYEQALILPTSQGLTVITGCAHPGIVEIVRYAKKLMKQDVHFVIGGFHLLPADSTKVRAIARELRKLTKYIGPCHCTGATAQEIFKDVFDEDYVDIHAGLRLELGKSRFE